MLKNKNRGQDFLLVFLKVLCLIVGLNICLTSGLIIIKQELNKDNLETRIIFHIKKFKLDHNL